jgi:hypothetical protein
MQLSVPAARVAVVLIAGAVVTAVAQSKTILPFDHIHLNEPAAEASHW